MKYSKKVEHRPDRIAAVRYPKKVGCRLDRIAAVRHPGGMSDNFRPGGMSYATRRKGGRLRGQERGTHMALFREDPTTVIIFRLNSLIRQLIISNCSFKTFEEYPLLGLG